MASITIHTKDKTATGSTALSKAPPSPPRTLSNASDDNDNDDYDDDEGDVDNDVEIPLPPPSKQPSEVLDIDKKTLDSHVPRDPRLIRLTGVHPFNVEAPLSALFNEGFLTSPELFYVRNHGAVPQVSDMETLDWEFSVEGMVETPFKLTLRQLLQDFPQVTYPVTLVCAGNRRKEQNVVRKTKGFSWGPAGVSTALFTGVAMSHIIAKARPRRGARYVIMQGADKLPNGYYTTNEKLNWVMDPNKGMMLSYAMNGEMLRPDHGKPLRVVIPGQIGGRSVKWLRRLILSGEPSDNYYHIYDNRVLPTTITPEESANRPDIWKDERYAIYDLSPNSAVAYPAHDEELSTSNGRETYRVKGYAYSGGGKRITRVELTLDRGRSWRLAEVEYPEDKYRESRRTLFGGRLDMEWRETCFCWCFWHLDISISDLADAKDIMVRSMDEGMNTQPRDMYWSVLGMMNNPWFRIVIHTDAEGALKFEHPTQPALMPGGWMERVKKAGGDLTNGYWGEDVGGEAGGAGKVPREPVKEISMKKDGLMKTISLEEFRKHEEGENPWFVVNGEVYDGTKFLEEHPGGAQSIISAAGQDATDEFMAIHSETAKAMMPTYHIGSLDEASRKALADPDIIVGDAGASSGPRPVFLHPRSWTPATLFAKRIVSWDTRIFTFQLQHPKQTLGLPTGQHLMIRLKDPSTGEAIVRSYTPISEATAEGFVDVLVKVYFASATVKGGRMSQAMDALAVGPDGAIDFKGPIGKFEYLGKGIYTINGREKYCTRFLMLCGGSGVTPIFQVYRAVMRDANDPTTCLVVDGNRTEEDILCREELDALTAQGNGRGRVYHTLSKAGDSWCGGRGRMDMDLIRKECPKDKTTVILICGPEPLEKALKEGLLEDGWDEDQMVFF